MSIQIHVLLNDVHVGDNSQAKAVGKALKATFDQSKQAYDYAEVNEATLDSLPDNIEGEPCQHFVVTAGEHGLLKVNELKAKTPEAFYISTAHMHFDVIDTMTHFPSVLSLPQGVLTEEQRQALQPKTKLIETLGVPHGISVESILEATQSMTFFDESIENNVVGIMLAGDAPDENKAMKFFSPDEAEKQAALIYKAAKAQYEKEGRTFDENTLFFVTNGPRTGKHDYETKEALEPNPHRVENARDDVSLRFIDAFRQLMEADKLNIQQLMFEDFKFGEPSAYQPMLRMLCEAKGLYFVPSESTSMVTEASHPAAQGVKVIAYRPSSENKSHEAHLTQSYHMGLMGILDKDGAYIERKDIPLLETDNAAKAVVTAVQAQLAMQGVYDRARKQQNAMFNRRVSFGGVKVEDEAVRLVDDVEALKEKKPTRSKNMSNELAIENAPEAAKKDEKGVLGRAYDSLPAMPERVKEHMTLKNAGIAGGVLLATFGLFAAGKAGYIANPFSSAPSPRGPSK